MATSPKAQSTTAEVEDQISQIRKDIAELTAVLSGLVETKASDLKAAAEGEAEHLVQRTREMADAAQDKTREATEALENHIKEKPIQSALIALTIGLVFGMLSRR